MNLSQKKHVKERLAGIQRQVHQKIMDRFNSNTNNAHPRQIAPIYPDEKETLLKLAGFESRAVLAYESKDLEEQLKRSNFSYGSNIRALSRPLNQAEVDNYIKISEEINQRRNQEVNVPLNNLNHQYQHCVDVLMLSEDNNFVLSEIERFETYANSL